MNNEIEFLYIGWCKGTNDGVKNDKVWTAFRVGGSYYAGWGARGKAIRFKKHDYGTDLKALSHKKDKTYNEVDTFQLFSIFPHFKDEVAARLTFSLIADTVMYN